MKNDFNKYLKSNEILRELNNKKKEYDNNFWRQQNEVTIYLQSHTMQEAQEHFKKDREAAKKTQEAQENMQAEIKKERLKNELLLNNVLYKFISNYDKAIFEIIGKYEAKKIGEKTTEKIEAEIKEEIAKNDLFKAADIYIYFRGDFNNYNLSIQIRKKQGDFWAYMFEYIINKATSYNCYEEATTTNYYRYKASNFNYNKYSINDLKYIENVNAEVKAILKQEQKQKAEIEKTRKALAEKEKSYNNFVSGYNLGEIGESYRVKISNNGY